MIQLRLSLGRKIASANLVTNGTFNSDLSGWTAGTGWVWAAPGVAHKASGSRNALAYSGILTPGKYYRVKITLVAGTAWVYIGNYTRNKISVLGVNQIEAVCLAGTDFSIVASGSSSKVDNIEVYELGYNNPLLNEPEGFDDAKFKVEKDKFFEALTYTYITDLEFKGDGYDYIWQTYITQGYCSEIAVLVEIKKSPLLDVWETFFEGAIFLKGCEFDYDTRTVKTTIENRAATQLFATAKDVKVYLDSDDFDYGKPIADNFAPKSRTFVDFHNTAGTYLTGIPYENVQCYRIYDLFRQILLYSTDFNIEFESDYFSSGEFATMVLTTGKFIRENNTDPPGAGNPFIDSDYGSISFTDLFTEMNKICDLGVKIYYNNGVPTLKVEPKKDFQNTTVVATLSHVKGIKSKVALDTFINVINIGYKTVSEQANYIHGAQYVSTDKCSQGQLNLICEYIADSTIIHQMLDGTIADDKYDSNIFIIETTGTEPNLQSAKTNISGIYFYNQGIRPSDNMQRWVESLPGDAFQLRDTEAVISRTTPSKKRLFEMDYPITFAMLQSILDNDAGLIEFESQNIGNDAISGLLLSLEFSVKTGMTKFRLLA
jgi:hypothetical protein